MTTSLRFRGSSAATEIMGSVKDFVERLEQLTAGSARVCLLDLDGVARHLAAAPAFLGTRCAPRVRYRHISNIAGLEGFRDLVRLIRRSAEAEKGAYLCVFKEALLRESTSFCVVERDDAVHVFLIHEIGGEGPTSVVRVDDREVGRLVLNRFERYWEGLTASARPLFDGGTLDPAQESRLLAACAENGTAGLGAAQRLRTAA